MDVKRKKILFLLPSMRGGGSERVISIILNHLDRTQFEPTLVLLQKEGIYLEDLPKELNIIDLKVVKARYGFVKIVKVINKIKPDIVMSTLGHINILVSFLKPLLPKATKYIARESSIVTMNNKNSKYPKILDYLYKKVFNNFDTIIAQSQFMKNDLVNNYLVEETKIKVIYNPLDIQKIENLSLEKSSFFDSSLCNILIVGRLSTEKNHKEILHILKMLNEKFHLTILGDGALKKELFELVKKLEIEDKVSFLDFERNPYKYMKQADVVVSTSLYEGFPNVLIEAIACSTPVIAYNSPGGTGEIIEKGLNGYLIPFGDHLKFCQTLEQLYASPLNKKEIQTSAERYEVKHIIKQYQNAFLSTLKK